MVKAKGTSKRRLSIAQKKGIAGVLFLMPVIIGLVFLFIIPLIDSFRFALSEVRFTDYGHSLEFVGWANFNNAFRINPNFNRYLFNAITGLIIDVPVIIILSFLFATILNQKFIGRSFSRAIFFLPVILASGAIARLDSANFLQNVMRESIANADTQTGVMRAFQLEQLLLGSGVDPTIVEYLTGSVDRIYQLIGMMGVQLLIFLAGLQSIPSTLYEASKVEGATSYETFWMITFPMLTPLILTNVIYTIVDSFMNNQLAEFIRDMAFLRFNFGLSAAMSWIYFVCITILLYVVVRIISRFVFYHDAER